MAMSGAAPSASRASRLGLMFSSRRKGSFRSAAPGPLEPAIRGKGLVGWVKSQLYVVRRAQHLAARKGDADVIHRVSRLAEQAVVEAEVAHAIGRRDQRRIEGERCCGLGVGKEVRGP